MGWPFDSPGQFGDWRCTEFHFRARLGPPRTAQPAFAACCRPANFTIPISRDFLFGVCSSTGPARLDAPSVLAETERHLPCQATSIVRLSDAEANLTRETLPRIVGVRGCHRF